MLHLEDIDAGGIYYGAFNTIREIVGDPFEYSDSSPGEDMIRCATLHEVYGVLRLAEKLLQSFGYEWKAEETRDGWSESESL